MTYLLFYSTDKPVVVIDNAHYHSRQTEESKTPKISWRKAEIQGGLRKKGIPFQDPKETS